MTDESLEASKWALMQAHQVMMSRHSKPSAVSTKKRAAQKEILTFEDLDAAGIGRGYKPVNLEPAAQALPAPLKLGPINRWRYESCQKDASQAPTAQGVSVGLHLCREKFQQ